MLPRTDCTNYKELQEAMKQLYSSETEYECQSAVTLLRSVAETQSFQGEVIEKNTTSVSAEAQFQLGLLYDFGDTVPENFEAANIWYMRAAKQEHAKSQYMLGNLFAVGNGVEKNETIAMGWYKKSAENGYARSFMCLADYYYHGRGVIPHSKSIAKELLQKAISICENKSIIADRQHYLSFCLFNGRGCDIDTNEATKQGFLAANAPFDKNNIVLTKTILAAQRDFGKYCEEGRVSLSILKDLCAEEKMLDHTYWYRKSAEGGYRSGIFDLARCLLAKNQWKEALYWLNRGAVRGHDQAALTLARCYDPLTFLDMKEKDMHKSLKWYHVAASRNNLDAIPRLVEILSSGNYEVKVDYKAAFDFCYKFIDIWKQNKTGNIFDHAYICFYLGQFYFHGMGTDQNHEAALRWMKLSSDEGNSGALYLMGTYFDNGVVGYIDKNHKMAISYFEKSSKCGQWRANLRLGQLYFEGTIVEKNLEKSIEYFSASLDDSSGNSFYYLGQIYSSRTQEYELHSSKESIKWYRCAIANSIDSKDIALFSLQLVLEIDYYIEYDYQLSHEARINLQAESLKCFEKVKLLKESWSNDLISKYDRYHSMRPIPCHVFECGKNSSNHNDVENKNTDELPKHSNIVPFDRLIHGDCFTLKDLIRVRRLSLEEIKYIGQQLCSALLHCQHNGFAMLQCLPSNIYILFPRAYQMGKIYLDKVQIHQPKLLREIVNMIGVYLTSKELKVKDITTDLIFHSDVILNNFDSCIAFKHPYGKNSAGYNSWILDPFEGPHFKDTTSIAPEIRNKAYKSRNCEFVNAYALGSILMLMYPSHFEEPKTAGFILALLEEDTSKRMTLEEAFSFLNN